MRLSKWQITLGLSLVLLSAVVYLGQFLIFGRATDMFFYMLQDLAFVPIQVLLVTLIISSLLESREKRARLEKMNMVMGTFFSEIGMKLLTHFCASDSDLDIIKGKLVVTKDWSKREFFNVSRLLKDHHYLVNIQKVDLEALRSLLESKRDFLLRLLENPILLEHESFTEVLQAVFHLTEELFSRRDLGKLPNSDLNHLGTDIKRAYVLLVEQWLAYMEYLKDNYPYLFSFAMRTNPFDRQASIIVQ